SSALGSWLALTISASVWLVPQFHHFGAPFHTIFPHFNILAWQFLFCIGMFLGVKYRAPKTRDMESETAIRRVCLALAWIVVIASCALRFSSFIRRNSGIDIGFLLPYDVLD